MKLEEETVLVNGIKNYVCTWNFEPIDDSDFITAKVYLTG